jgi:hypothetical protein
MSSASPILPSGMAREICASSWSSASAVGAAKFQIGVRVPPGTTRFTRMPFGASSEASTRDMARSPALAAA